MNMVPTTQISHGVEAKTGQQDKCISALKSLWFSRNIQISSSFLWLVALDFASNSADVVGTSCAVLGVQLSKL